ncbi:MAG TPA: ATP-binding protein [Chitinophagaceae bacterium]|nr:ATP-binding protein [Chitinophagaceae bacterium]
MDPFFRKLPLSIKLLLIGLIPVLFLVYVVGQLYIEKNIRVSIVRDHIVHIHEAGNISNLIYQLERERKFSYEYALKKDSFGKLTIQQPLTDTLIATLEKSDDPDLKNFAQYTFLSRLDSVRKSLDRYPNYSPDSVMEFYTNLIQRLNSLNPISSVSNIYLQPVYTDLTSQKMLFEILIYLSIIRTDIYRVLYNRQFETEKVSKNSSNYSIYKSYEKEFLMKASKASADSYLAQKDSPYLKPVLTFIDKAFQSHTIDSNYSAEDWWQLSSLGLRSLKLLQVALWQKAEAGMNGIYRSELKSKNRTLVFLVTAIVFVIALVLYTIGVINKMLSELKTAAQKIAVGKTDLAIHNMPNDVMGSLSDSILEIDKNNKELANAANAIGKGNFNVPVIPRSEQDVLGNSLQKMKEDLYKLTLEKDKVQEQTLELMKRKDDFLSIASHELKTPVTSLKAYTQLLQQEAHERSDEKKESMYAKMDLQVDKLTSLINDLLDTTKIQNGKLVYNQQLFDFDDLVKATVEEIQVSNSDHKIVIEKNPHVQIFGDRERISQVLSNLLNNAIKYCPDSPLIIIKSEIDRNQVTCSVQDFGCGINENDQGRIFEQFYRATDKNMHTFPGLGLGLFIAREIITRHNGKIWFTSTEEEGSTFYFSLPVVKNKKQAEVNMIK